MRTVAFALCAVAVIAVSGASAAVCTQPAGYVYAGASAACPAYNACGATFCGCAGSTSTNATTCLANVAAPACLSIQTCMLAYQQCVEGLTSFRSNASSECFSLGTSIYTARLAAASGGYATSGLQKSCAYLACQVMNATATTCDFGVDSANVCMFAATGNVTNTTTAAPAVATPVPATLPPGFVAAITALIKIDGTGFAALLSGTGAALRNAVASDLARLLGVSSASFIQITNMYLGSLVVEFAVSADAGVQPSLLSAALNLATTTNWLNSTQAVYSTVSTETLAVTTPPTIVSSAPPGVVTPAPPTTTAAPADLSASAGVTSVAAIAIAAVAVLAAF